jgi:hypothetical protein
MDEADGRLLEAADLRPLRFGSLAHTMTLQASMDGAAGEVGVYASPHDFDDVVERQIQPGAQFADQLLFQDREADGHPLWPMRAVRGRGSLAPAADGSVADAEFCNEFCGRSRAVLDVSPRLRRGRGIGMQVQLHDARRSAMYDTPRFTPIPFSQSCGTKHEGGDGWPVSTA